MHRFRHQFLTALIVCALLVLASCSGHAPPPPVAPLPGKAVMDTVQGGTTLALPRPTAGVAELALWIRAGARDAAPAQLATAAAYWAEEKTGAKARVLPDDAPCWKTYVRYGSPRYVVAKAVRELEPDLLLLGTHGYSGVARAFLGTVAGDLLREAKCDVLVVPPSRSRR